MEELRSTIQSIQDLKASSGWLDIKSTLEGKLKNLRDSLEVLIEIDAIARTQGRIEEIRIMLDLPDIIKETIIDNTTRR